MAGTKQQGLAVLAPVRGNGECWSGGCGAELKPSEGVPAACFTIDRFVK